LPLGVITKKLVATEHLIESHTLQDSERA